MIERVLWKENVRMFAEWCSPNPDNLVLVRLIPAWFGSVWWFQWFLALIWSGLEIIFNIDIQICFNVNDSGELYNAKIVWKRFFGWKSNFFIGNSSFDRRTEVSSYENITFNQKSFFFVRKFFIENFIFGWEIDVFCTKTTIFDLKFEFWPRTWKFFVRKPKFLIENPNLEKLTFFVKN